MTAAVVVISRRGVPAIPATATVGSSMEPGAAASRDESDVWLDAGQRRNRHRLNRDPRESEKSQCRGYKNPHPRPPDASRLKEI